MILHGVRTEQDIFTTLGQALKTQEDEMHVMHKANRKGTIDTKHDAGCLGMVIIDADGKPLRKWNALKHLLCKKAYVVLDDVVYERKLTAHAKAAQIFATTPCSHMIGLFGFGTYFMTVDCSRASPSA